jgi:hypothetical protein
MRLLPISTACFRLTDMVCQSRNRVLAVPSDDF